VLNLYSNVRCADLVFAGDDSADVWFYEPEVVAQCLEEAVAAALAQAAGVSRDPVVAMNRRAVAPVKSGFVSRSRTVSKTPRIIKPFRVAARKRATSAIDPDIQAALDELVSPFAGSDSPVAVLPLTAPAARRRAASANVRSGLSLGSAPVLRRPRSASEVQQGFRASAPSWTNPCLTSRGTALARAVDAPRAACCPSVDSPALDLRQVRISRADIPHLKVVGQSDCKFIIVVDADAVLYAVDQHAASERAHYELLQRNALQASADGVASGIYAGAPGALTLVTLTTRQVATLALHEAHLRRWGWHVVRLGGLVAALTHEIVTAPHISETGVAVDSAAQLTAHLDGLAGGAVASAVPRPILDALATSACHTAVRFGDALTHAQCVAIVRDLASCDLPFSCAHGRPSIVPLVVL
jgi:DNA mismatch repair ATPase MutL